MTAAIDAPEYVGALLRVTSAANQPHDRRRRAAETYWAAERQAAAVAAVREPVVAWPQWLAETGRNHAEPSGETKASAATLT